MDSSPPNNVSTDGAAGDEPVGAVGTASPMDVSKTRGNRVRRLAMLFRGSPRAHGHYSVDQSRDAGGKKGGRARTVHEPATDAVFEAHLDGVYGMGAVPLLLDPPGHTVWAAIDIDDYNVDVAVIARMSHARELPVVVCRSKSGGAHLYVFFFEPVETVVVRRKLREWAAAVGYKDAEIFPKQDRLADENTNGDSFWGNWINLPYQWGERSTRYALGTDGTALSLDEFLATAEDARLSKAELESFPVLLPRATPSAEPESGESKKSSRRGYQAWGLTESHASIRLQNALYDIRSLNEGGRNKGVFLNACVWFKYSGAVGISEADVRRVIHDAVSRQEQPLPYAEVNQTINSAYKTVNRGREAIHYLGTPLDPDKIAAAALEGRGEVNPVAELMDEFNDKYMVVNEDGKIWVYMPKRDPILGRSYHQRISFADFGKLHMNRPVCVGHSQSGKPIFKLAGELWLHHAERKQYIDGIVFDPSKVGAPAGTLNLWQGLAVDPCEGTWTLFRNHMRSVLCADDEASFNKLYGWMARLVQRPWEQGEMAVVLNGLQGTGKGIFANALVHIHGQHALKISQGSHLTGKFNDHLRDCVFLFADEAFFPGDKQHVGVLKSLITEREITIEPKYGKVVQTTNFVHLLMASNNRHVVPAELDARRFFVLNVLPTRKDDHEYFKAIVDELESGGYEAMLHDLKAYDLSRYNHREVLVTPGLEDQKKQSLEPEFAWWKEILHRSYVFESKHGMEDYFGKWQDWVATEVLYRSYEAHARVHRVYRPMSREDLGKFLKAMADRTGRKRGGEVGEHRTDVTDDDGHTRQTGRLIYGGRPTGYHFGTIAEARVRFETETSLPVDWPDDGDSESEVGDAAAYASGANNRQQTVRTVPNLLAAVGDDVTSPLVKVEPQDEDDIPF